MAWARVSGAIIASVSAGSGGNTFALSALGAAVSVGHRIIGVSMVALFGDTPIVSSVTDSLGNTYTKDAAVRFASNATEVAVWSAPVTTGGTPTITLHFDRNISGSGLFNGAFAAYSGLSTAANAVDVFAITSGTASTADSGTTGGTTTAANELKAGFYADGGDGTTLSAGTLDTTYSAFINHSPDGTFGQDVIEDADAGSSGSTARATITGSIGGGGWGMAVVVYKLAASGLTAAQEAGIFDQQLSGQLVGLVEL